MSAIEMMDPKMDAGMAKGSVKRRTPLSLNDAIENKTLPWENVSASEFVTIYDHTLSCLVTWFEGHSLAQTVLTNLVSTVWKFRDFSVTWILREINLSGFKSSKTAVYANLGALNIVDLAYFRFQKAPKFMKIKIQSL